jgi:hypothetical protein
MFTAMRHDATLDIHCLSCFYVLLTVHNFYKTVYNLVNKANLVHNLFLVYLSISTCFGWLWAHHQEKQLCLCDTWCLLFCVDDSLLCRQSSTQNNNYQVSHKHSCFSWWWAHSRPKHVQIDKYIKNKMCTKLVLFKRLPILCIFFIWCWKRIREEINNSD